MSNADTTISILAECYLYLRQPLSSLHRRKGVSEREMTRLNMHNIFAISCDIYRRVDYSGDLLWAWYLIHLLAVPGTYSLI